MVRWLRSVMIGVRVYRLYPQISGIVFAYYVEKEDIALCVQNDE